MHDRAWVADWQNFLFVHFSLPVGALAPHVPFALEVRDGRAFVSLVLFTLERMRLPYTGALGELIFRPISNHPFLNVRTYVTHGGVSGICFLAEWIPNPISLRLGPATYGLPYRFGHFDREVRRDDGITRIGVEDPNKHAALGISVPHRAHWLGRLRTGYD